jgi:hypothetical protein
MGKIDWLEKKKMCVGGDKQKTVTAPHVALDNARLPDRGI